MFITKFMQLNSRRINPGYLSEANLSVGQLIWRQLFDANIYRPFILGQIRHPTEARSGLLEIQFSLFVAS